MKKKIIEVIIEDFECVWCGHKEYFVTDPYSDKKRKIYCDRCGRINHVDYKMVKSDLPKYTASGLNEEEKFSDEETFVVVGALICVLVFLFILFVLFCLF
jgi:transcription elongation factor Elf1